MKEETFFKKFRRHLKSMKPIFHKKDLLKEIKTFHCPFGCSICRVAKKCSYDENCLCKFKFKEYTAYRYSWKDSSFYYIEHITNPKLRKKMIEMVNKVYK